MISFFLNAMRPSCKTLWSAPLLAASLLHCVTGYAQSYFPPTTGSCSYSSVALGAWQNIKQVDYLTATDGMVLAEAPVRMSWTYKAGSR